MGLVKMEGKFRELDGKAWVAQGGVLKMIYILWKFILSRGACFFPARRAFWMGYWCFWYLMQIMYIIINSEISSNQQEIILFGGASFFPARRAFWMGYLSFYDSFYLIRSKRECGAYNSGPFLCSISGIIRILLTGTSSILAL